MKNYNSMYNLLRVADIRMAQYVERQNANKFKPTYKTRKLNRELAQKQYQSILN